MDDNFIIKNKEALLEEMSSQLNLMNEILNDCVNNDVIGDQSINLEILNKCIINFSKSLGYIIACYNQYYALLTGNIGEETKPIGFNSLINENI